MKLNIIILYISIILFNGCSINNNAISLNHTTNTINIQNSNSTIPIHLKTTNISNKNTNFVSLYLSQKLLKLSNGETIVYENAQTNLEYEFEPPIYRIIKVVFEPISIIPIYHANHIYVDQLILKDRVINLIAYQAYSQELTLLYGMSNQTLSTILYQLNPNNKYHIPKKATPISSKNPFLTKWNDWKVHFVPLVVPLARLMMPF